MMKKFILAALLLCAFAVPAHAQWAQAIPQFLTTGQGGTGVPYGAPQTSLLTGASGSYTVPTGATWLDVKVSGPGGGGGACLSGGSTAIAGGGGAAGAFAEGIIRSPSGSYAYANGTGGTAGACAASIPTAAGAGSASSTFGTGNGQLVGAAGAAGATCTNTSTNGAGGTSTGAMGIGFGGTTNINVILAQGGTAGHVGVGDVTTDLGAWGSGSKGGTGYTVTSGGSCHNASTAGDNGHIEVTAYFN